MIKKINDKEQKARIAQIVLKDLPEWFGLPESTKEYIEKSKKMPFWSYQEGEESRGFVALKETSQHTAEIYVMGVLKKYHGHSIGTKLFDIFYKYAQKKGYSFLQVKTVKEGLYSEYDQTNRFYRKMGFKELECFPNLWDEHNPCQIYVKAINFKLDNIKNNSYNV